MPIDSIAITVGFASAITFRQAFAATPTDYRNRYL